MDWWWSWLLTFTGVTTFFLAGKKVWWAWHVGLFVNQPIWLIYGILSDQWGFIASTLFYTAVYSKNAWKWTKEHKEEQKYNNWRDDHPDFMPLSIGFKFDSSSFSRSARVTETAMVNLKEKFEYGSKRWRWLPLWIRERIFKPIYMKNGPGGAVIGKVKHMEMRDNGLFVTSEIDRSTPEGQKAWAKIKGPDQDDIFKVPEKGMGSVLKKVLDSPLEPGPPYTHTATFSYCLNDMTDNGCVENGCFNKQCTKFDHCQSCGHIILDRRELRDDKCAYCPEVVEAEKRNPADC